MLRQAEYHHGTDLTTLDRPNIPRTLRRLLELYVLSSGLTASELEARFYELCCAASIPLPSMQQFISPHRVDFTWPDLKLIVETDGRDAHDRSIAFTEDRRRDRTLQLDGWIVLRYTWAEIAYAPGDVTVEIVGAINMRR